MFITNIDDVGSAEFPHVAVGVTSKMPFPEWNEDEGAYGCLAFPVFPVGTTATRHQHATSAEWYIIQEGRASITIDEETAEIGPGDVIYTPIGSTHNIHDVTEELQFIALKMPRAIPETAPAGRSAGG